MLPFLLPKKFTIPISEPLVNAMAVSDTVAFTLVEYELKPVKDTVFGVVFVTEKL